jgi:hypothetical protein
MLARCGRQGQSVLARRLSAVLAEHPDPPQYRFDRIDSDVFWLLNALVGRYGPLDADGVELARSVTAKHRWASERLAEVMAQLEGQPPPNVRLADIDPTTRVVPRWGMKLRRVDTPEPGPTTRFGGQPYFPDEPVWPVHPKLSIPLSFLGQIVIPSTVLGDGTWLAHLFVDVSPVDDFVPDPEYPYEVPPTAVIVHPGGRWWGPTEARREGPTYAHERDFERDKGRFLPGPQFGFVTTEVDLEPGADPVAWPKTESFRTTGGDWNKVGGAPMTIQGGEEEWIAKGWKFLASFGAGWIGHEMGDVAECYVWVHPDGRGLLHVQGH